MRETALMLSPEAPYPLAGGGPLRTASLLHYLSQRYTVDLAVFREPGAPDPRGLLPAGLVRDVFVLELPRHRKSAAARACRNSVRLLRRRPPLLDRFSGCGDRLSLCLAGRAYSVAVVEHFWCAPYIEQLERIAGRCVLNLHNVESVLHEACAATGQGPGRIAHRLFGSACRLLEQRWLPRYSCVLTASAADAERVRGLTAAAVYPNALPLIPAPASDPDDAIVFSGNLEYHPNLAAVEYFFREVWPLVRSRSPGVEWRLVGKNPHAVEGLVNGDSRIQVVGAVDNAVAEIGRAKVAVVPLLAGSGTRFKILEAWAAGVPVVSTSVGAEGLEAVHGENIIIANRPEEFAGAVLDLIGNAQARALLGAGGRSSYEQKFTWTAAWKRLDL